MGPSISDRGVFICFFFLIDLCLSISNGQLGIAINSDLGLGPGKNLVYGTIAEIKDLRTWTDDEIVDMAFVAHADVKAAHNSIDFAEYPGVPRRLPAVTTVLIVDNTAYISSSMRGGSYLYQPNIGVKEGSRFTTLDPDRPCTAVQDALARCQMKPINRGTGHRTGASCGEAMSALAFCATHVQKTLEGAKIVSVTGRDDPKILAPCGHPDGQLAYEGEWGCHDFTTEEQLRMHVIPEGTGRQSRDVSSDDITVSPVVYP